MALPGAHDARDEIADLHRLLGAAHVDPPYVLGAAHVDPPYVLVGHS